MDIQGGLTLKDGQQLENHGVIRGCMTQLLNHWNSMVNNMPDGSIEKIRMTGGNEGYTYNLGGRIDEVIVEGGIFYNNNGALVKNLTVAGGHAYNALVNPASMPTAALPLKAPVIENAAVTAGMLINNDSSDKMLETQPAIIKKLTADFTQTNVVDIQNFDGGLIQEAILDGGDGTPASDHGTVFKNYWGGVVNKLSVNGNAGYKIWNGNVSETYGTPVIKELVMDGGYAKFTNYNGARVEKGTIENNNTFSMNNLASAGELIVKQSNVLNNYNGADDPAQACRIDKLFNVGRSVINNWDVGEIGELYIIGEPTVSGINLDPYGPFDAPGRIGKLYYKIDAAADTPAVFSFDDGRNISTIVDGDDYDGRWYGKGSFNGVYGEPEKTILFSAAYTGDGKLTGVQMNDTELSAGTNGNYSFTMPYQNAILSASGRALKGDATLSSLTYSVNGGEPVPVPEFAANNGLYYITLPRETPRDATVTLAGVPADADAKITVYSDGKLVYGATKYQAPASLTVKAEDGTEKTYSVSFYTQPAEADMKDTAIGGIEDGKTFIQDETPAFTASGSGMENGKPAVDDERYRPASWKIDDGTVLSGSWDGAPFSESLGLSKLSKGTHTLTVTYNWERFGEIYENDEPTGEYGWVVMTPDLPEKLTKNVSFVVNPVTYALTVENGTDKTGGSPYEAGTEVSIEAAAPPAGYVFDKWVLTSGTGTFVDALKAETVFTMGTGEATVTAAYKDAEAPTGIITIAANAWKEFLNTITFDLFYQDSQDVTITAQDTSGEPVKTEYFLSAEALTLDEVHGEIQVWTAYTGTFSVNPDKKFIVFARLTDKAGNVTYLSSDGVVLDATAPVISGIEDGKTYSEAKSVTVTDAYLVEVKLNGAEQVINQNMSVFTLTENGSYTITAKDRAGNEATAAVTIDIPPETYVLTFDTDGGAPIPPAQTLEAGKKPAEVAEPEKKGHTFLGWYNSDNVKINLSQFEMPETNVTLTARWEENAYTLTVENGTGGGQYKAGKQVSIGATVPEGKEFVRWELKSGEGTLKDAQSEQTVFTMAESDAAVAAVFKDFDPTEPAPSDPTEPNNPTNPSAPAKPDTPSDTPQTGDKSPLWPLLATLLALGGIGGTLLIADRRKGKNR